MNLKASTLEWIEYADHDLLAAKTPPASPRVPFEIVAYHCRQATEKYMKAVLIGNGASVPFIHDLMKLNREAQAYYPGLQNLEKVCELLTPFGTATRYPEALPAEKD